MKKWIFYFDARSESINQITREWASHWITRSGKYFNQSRKIIRFQSFNRSLPLYNSDSCPSANNERHQSKIWLLPPFFSFLFLLFVFIKIEISPLLLKLSRWFFNFAKEHTDIILKCMQLFLYRMYTIDWNLSEFVIRRTALLVRTVRRFWWIVRNFPA